MKLHFPVRAISKDNYKVFNRNGRPFLSREFKEFEKLVKFLAVQQLDPHYRLYDKENLRVILTATYKNHVRPDAGNIPKSILDACQGVLFTNDKMIIDLHIKIQYGNEDSFDLEVYENDRSNAGPGNSGS